MPCSHSTPIYCLHPALALCPVSPHLPLSILFPWCSTCAKQRRCLPWSAAHLGWQARCMCCAVFCCWLSPAARRCCSALRADDRVRATGSPRRPPHCGGADCGRSLLPPSPHPAASSSVGAARPRGGVDRSSASWSATLHLRICAASCSLCCPSGVLPCEPGAAPALQPIRLPGPPVTRGLLPPANPLPHELLVLWAEAGVAKLRCLPFIFHVPVCRFVPCAAPTLPCAAVWSSFGVVSHHWKTAKAVFCGSWAASEAPSIVLVRCGCTRLARQRLN